MIERHEWKWMRTPTLIAFVGTFAVFGILGAVEGKPIGMVLGLSSIAAIAVALLVAWKTLEFKRAHIAATAYEDIVAGGMGAVIVDTKTGKARPLAASKRRKR